MASNERGGLFSAIKELKNILERAPHGVVLADLIDRSPRLRRLSFAEKREVLDKLFCNGIIRSYRLQGTERFVLFHKMFSPPESMDGCRLIPEDQPDNYIRPALPDITEEVAIIQERILKQKTTITKEEKPMTVPAPTKATKAVLNVPVLSADELRKQAEQLIKAAEAAEQLERNAALRETILPIQLQVAKAVVAVQKHVDGLVDATSELEKAAELLRKAMAEAD